ncbi:collagenase [Thalassotalea agarivorans]|uniref:Microbial collagenase n=1 Tax=Thalassotalea agarivorans TaxID=349064 RepID=A0A1I0BQG9_THASX|nr:collagenase [Thalassotalea agarivorans]SET08876.1 microbial collagenase [Thalassotalea agarivorans]
MKQLFLVGICALLTACKDAPTSKQEDNANTTCIEAYPATAQYLLSLEHKGWNSCFNHQSEGLIDSVTAAIIAESQQQSVSQDLDDLLYYLRAHSYYVDTDELTKAQRAQLSSAIDAVTTRADFYHQNDSARRLQEHVLVTLYRYFATDDGANVVSEHVSTLVTLLAQFNGVDVSTLSKQGQYTLWELYRTLGFVSFEARDQSELKEKIMGDEENSTALMNAIDKHMHSLTTNDWPLTHTLWLAASQHYIANEAQQTALDKKVSEYLFNHANLSDLEQRELFSQHYLVNSYRYHEQCETDFKGQCEIPTIDEFLPVNHTCSDTLFIRATQMTAEQLEQSCTVLTSQERFFHDTLATGRVPTADDQNTKLRVVIFDNYSEYNRWGQLFFNIGTDNGGMYIEGDPAKEGNQATYYAFEAFWKQPAFSVWNLNHEYVHYLDGRFVKYGTFGHFPSHLVWWSEGIAEYISKQNANKRSFALLRKKEEGQWPTLKDIFATSYNDGADRVYRWSYQAIRYLAENYLEQLQALGHALKDNDFERYARLLDTLASEHQADFRAWQTSHKPAETEAVKTPDEYTPTYMWRYMYRAYLMPASLEINDRHKHFENWG